jgi:5'-nucleotidase
MKTNIERTIMRILLVASLFLTACAVTPESTSDDSSQLTFIHLNDTYRVGAVEDGNKGGFGRVVTLIRDLQSEGRDVRILHGGDFLFPSLESQLWSGMQIVDALNYIDDLAPLYAVAGNHEFDPRTPAHLIDAVRASRFDWLGDNYTFNTGETDVDKALNKSFTFEHGGKTIGIFAIMIPPGYGGTDRDYVPTDGDFLGIARKTIEHFESQGVDAIIGVTHLHLWQDQEIAKLKKDHPKLMFVVGGHEHEPPLSVATDDSAAVMKGASNARVVWQIDLMFDAAGNPSIDARMLEMGQQVVADADYELLDKKWRDRLLKKYPFLTAQVGKAAVALDATEEKVRNAENGWGNFIVDQMRGAFGEPAVDFAFINSGTLRIDDTISGDILYEDIGRTFGFSSFLRYMTVSGAEFIKVMEAGYRGVGPSKGYFPQVSGFRVCVDRSLESGSRIVSLQIPNGSGWQEIDAGKDYTLVVPDFLYRGGDGYQLPKDRPASRTGSELKYLVLDAIVRAQAEGRAVGALPDPANPRYAEISSDRKECFR